MKKIIQKTILWRDIPLDANWGYIKTLLKERNIELQDSDVIEISTNVEALDEDISKFIGINRLELESDEQYSYRLKEEKKAAEEFKKRRYASYLILN